MRGGRLVRRIALGTVVLVVALIVAAAMISQTAAFRDWLRRQVVATLNEGLNGELTLGRLDGNLVQGLTLTDLRLRSEGRRVIAVRRVSARYDLVRLLTGGGLVLRDAEISGLSLLLLEDERGWNVARLYAPRTEQEKGSTLTVVLERARVGNAALKVVRARDVWRVRDLRFAGSGRFAADGQALTIDSFSCALPGRQVDVAELTGAVAVAADGSVRADAVHLRTGASELRADARVPGRDGGDYDVTLDGRLAAAELRRLLRSRQPAVDFAPTVHVRGPAEWAAIDAQVRSDAGTLALAGHVGQGEPLSYDLRATLTGVDAAGLLGPAQPVTHLNGTLDVKGKGTTPAQAAASVALALHDSVVSGRNISRLSVSGDVAAQQVRFDAATTLESGEAEASGTISIADERYDVRLTTRQFDPAPLVGRPDLHASVNATLTVAGTGFEPARARADAHLTMTPSRIERLDVASAVADVRAEQGTLTIERLRVAASALAVDASGTLSLRERATDATGTVRYSVRAADLAPLARIADAGPLGGALSLEGTASGALTDLDVRATLSGRQLARADTQIGTLTATVRGDGIGGAHGRADVAVEASDVHAASRHFATVQIDAHWQQEAAGRSAAHASVRAQEDARRRHELVADLALDARERRVTVTTLRLDLGDDTWRADGTPLIVQRGERLAIERFVLRSPRGVVSVDGTAGASGTQDLRLRVDGLDLAVLAPSLQADVSGRVSASAHLGGTAQAPAITAHAAVDAPRIEGVAYESAVLDVQIGGGRAAVAAQVVQSGPRQLTLDVSSPLRLSLSPFAYTGSGAVSGRLRASAIDLAFLDPMLSQVSKLGGTLEADLEIGGTLAAPELRGPLAIADGRAYVVPLGLTYDPIELRMTLAGPAASIESVRVVSRNGTLTGGGDARIGAEGATVDVRIRLERFPLFANEFGEGAASGWMWVSGTTAAPVVEGALTTDRLVLLIPEVLPGSVRPPDPTITVVGPGAPAGPEMPMAARQVAAAAEPPPQPPVPKPGVYERAAITVQIDIPRDAWIRRSDTNVELRGWMTAWKKPDAELALAGDIETVRGWYTFQGKTFTLEEGRVTFTGQDFNPLVQLTAVHKAGDYTVRVKIGGTLTKPTLTLESEPSLDQADILSVLLFGKPAGQLNQGESAGLREQAIGVASSYVASELRQSVADALGLDTLQFESGSSGLPSVSLGKYLAPDVFVSLAHRFARQGVQELRVEYSVTPHWSVETSADTLGESGIDVFWKNRY